MSMTEEQAQSFLSIEKEILRRVSVTETILIVICSLAGLMALGVALLFIFG